MARKPKYTKNEEFFRQSSREMWYVAGIFAGDGDVSAHNTSISLEWQISDYDHLVTIKNLLSEEVPAYVRTRENREYCRFFVYNAQLHDDLIALGITPKKSFTLRLPEVPPKYFWDFLRGVFDSDGSLSKITRKIKPCYPRFKITNNEPFLEQLKGVLEKQTGLVFPKLYVYPESTHPTIKTAELTITGVGAMKTLHSMYKNSTENLRLGRKYEIFKTWTKDSKYVNQT